METETLTPTPPLLQWQPEFHQSTDPVIALPGFKAVTGLEPQQIRNFERFANLCVFWKNPVDSKDFVTFRLSHGRDVDSDGNCLFLSTNKVIGHDKDSTLNFDIYDAQEIRRRCVSRFMKDFEADDGPGQVAVNEVIQNLYSPDLGKGWGIRVVQEVKLIVKKSKRIALNKAILDLVNSGWQRELAAEKIYKDRCIPVNDGESWAKYLLISGSPEDEYDIITLQYTEDGLLSVDENREGHADAFGDDIAIESLATVFEREVYVVQAHGYDGMVEEENCAFFLLHRPRGKICGPPIFLFMKGTGWCGAGADHYEPLVATPLTNVSQEKATAIVL